VIAVALMRIQATIKTKGLAKSQRFVFIFVVWKKMMAVFLVFVGERMIGSGGCVCFYIYWGMCMLLYILGDVYAYIYI